MEGSTSESSCKESPVSQDPTASVETQKEVISEPQKKKQHVGMTASEKKKLYKAKLTYKKEWEAKYPWVCCIDPSLGMFCGICQKLGKNPAGSRGAWTSRGINDWNHATELLKQHGDSTWHRDAAATAAMAEQADKGGSVIQLHAREVAKTKQRNREVLLKLLRSVYFLARNRIPHSTIYGELNKKNKRRMCAMCILMLGR